MYTETLKQLGVTEEQMQKFETFFDLLLAYNAHTNLTAIVDKEQVFVKHFADSLLPRALLSQNASVVDIGCGAGFPSLPLAIVRSDLQFLLVDSVAKKLKFVQQVVDVLHLQNVQVLHSRAEDITKREHFDFCVARAVAGLPTLMEYCVPFVKVGGQVLAYKSNEIEEELADANKAITLLGGVLQEVVPLDLPGTDIVRKIVIVQKIKKTESKYPRSGNKPRTNPL
ncbi:MAG: 16S rRNA (guanine(527)-N(7))-methyltransferase RsmG [Firmicutes bacterium]|nr:16S rRNA (guanine(527)-N(7))-methyltransferase RsmG [Bacillota bacterium]